MIIRRMVESDIPQLVQLESLCFSDPWSVSAFRYELKNPLSDWLVADGQGVVAGYVGSQTVLDGSDMMNIAVSPDFRRQGIAQILIAELIKTLSSRGSRSLSLEVRISNEPALALYNKLGFKEVGRRPGYYRNPREDAFILRKEWD